MYQMLTDKKEKNKKSFSRTKLRFNYYIWKEIRYLQKALETILFP